MAVQIIKTMLMIKSKKFDVNYKIIRKKTSIQLFANENATDTENMYKYRYIIMCISMKLGIQDFRISRDQDSVI